MFEERKATMRETHLFIIVREKALQAQRRFTAREADIVAYSVLHDPIHDALDGLTGIINEARAGAR